MGQKNQLHRQPPTHRLRTHRSPRARPHKVGPQRPLPKRTADGPRPQQPPPSTVPDLANPQLSCVLVALARLERLKELQGNRNPYAGPLRKRCLGEAIALLKKSLDI